MKIKYLEQTPKQLYFPKIEDDLPLKSREIEDVVEIFQTPLEGAYNWDYTDQDNRIKKLYELGKKLNWNSTTDLDWNSPHPPVVDLETVTFWNDFPAYAKLSDKRKREFLRHRNCFNLSQFLHGEQGALLVASQLVSCAPTYNAKLYAASQTFDEARHVEVFNKYIQSRLGFMYPIGKGLKLLIDKILQDSRWDLKFIGMQIIIEGLALAAFRSTQLHTRDPLLAQLLEYVLRDEARHVTFGVNYLEEFVHTLSEEERSERAWFAYEACVISRDRFTFEDVLNHFEFPIEQANAYLKERDGNQEFRRLLFSRIIPNLSRIGLLTDEVRPAYDKLGLLSYEEMPDDWEIDWSEMSKPLDTLQSVQHS